MRGRIIHTDTEVFFITKSHCHAAMLHGGRHRHQSLANCWVKRWANMIARPFVNRCSIDGPICDLLLCQLQAQIVVDVNVLPHRNCPALFDKETN